MKEAWKGNECRRLAFHDTRHYLKKGVKGNKMLIYLRMRAGMFQAKPMRLLLYWMSAWMNLLVEAQWRAAAASCGESEVNLCFLWYICLPLPSSVTHKLCPRLFAPSPRSEVTVRNKCSRLMKVHSRKLFLSATSLPLSPHTLPRVSPMSSRHRSWNRETPSPRCFVIDVDRGCSEEFRGVEGVVWQHC